jgi:hypothetical protein
MTDDEVVKKVRSQIAWALYGDYGGRGESIMKEVWEELDGEEYDVADQELKRIILMLVPDFKIKDKR